MPTQSRAICSHDLPRLSRSPLIRSHDGSAAAAASHKSAAPPAQSVLNPGSVSLGRASAKLNGRAAALAGPLGFYSSFCLCARWCGGDSPQASSIIVMVVIIILIIIVIIVVMIITIVRRPLWGERRWEILAFRSEGSNDSSFEARPSALDSGIR